MNALWINICITKRENLTTNLGGSLVVICVIRKSICDQDVVKISTKNKENVVRIVRTSGLIIIIYWKCHLRPPNEKQVSILVMVYVTKVLNVEYWLRLPHPKLAFRFHLILVMQHYTHFAFNFGGHDFFLCGHYRYLCFELPVMSLELKTRVTEHASNGITLEKNSFIRWLGGEGVFASPNLGAKSLKQPLRWLSEPLINLHTFRCHRSITEHKEIAREQIVI